MKNVVWNFARKNIQNTMSNLAGNGGPRERACTFLLHTKGTAPTASSIQKKLACASQNLKEEGLEEAIRWMAQGDQSMHTLLMPVIRYVVPSSGHRIKKLQTLFWECVDKVNLDGSLKEEIVLACNSLRNDLLAHNEFVRGSTLRLLCKIPYLKMSQPLIEPITQNLSHRSSYVRRHAVMCLFFIVTQFGHETAPDAVDQVYTILQNETDLSTRRNAYLMMLHCNIEKALEFTLEQQNALHEYGDIFQLVVLDLLRKVHSEAPEHTTSVLSVVVSMMEKCGPAVAFEAACCIVQLTCNQIALKAAARCLARLLPSQTDNNVRLIVLDFLETMANTQPSAVQAYVIDILRCHNFPSIEIKKKATEVALVLLSHNNAEDVLNVLKKEIVKGRTETADKLTTYDENLTKLLLRTCHQSCILVPSLCDGLVTILVDLLEETHGAWSIESLEVLRDIIIRFPAQRAPTFRILMEALPNISSSNILRTINWMIGEFCTSPQLAREYVKVTWQFISPFPLTPVETSAPDPQTGGPKVSKILTRTVVLPDGTYGTENLLQDENQFSRNTDEGVKHLRTMICSSDFLIASVVAVALTKVSANFLFKEKSHKNQHSIVLVVQIVSRLLQLMSRHPKGDKRDSNATRIRTCLLFLKESLEGSKSKAASLAETCFSVKETTEYEKLEKIDFKKDENNDIASLFPQDCIRFRQLKPSRGLVFDGIDSGGDLRVLDDEESTFELPFQMKLAGDNVNNFHFQERIQKSVGLTGLADNIYVEAFMRVHHFNVILELLLCNRTNETLENVTAELFTTGDIRIVEKPTSVILPPWSTKTVKATVKVNSTEQSVVFGYVNYDKKNVVGGDWLILDELKIDLLEYMRKHPISEETFRAKWTEFEWENKLAVNSSESDPDEFLNKLIECTHLGLLGSENQMKTLSGTSFFAVNLYAKSVFGEDALANVALEKTAENKLYGSVRIRCRSQGMALTLGDRITVLKN
eukprot:GHVP01048253.1.p1 GENE.GHVP01048253.1~~GHVP01048253.1.p1  ORF type:complete len:983 (-),score=191.30 GHVP01048253.1:3180-6128(-)